MDVPAPAEGPQDAAVADGAPATTEAPAAATGPPRRNLLAVLVLLAATVTVYFFCLLYWWCVEVNGLLRRRKYRPGIMVLVSLLSLGGAGLAIECLLALDLERLGRERGTARRLPGLTALVAALSLGNLLVNLPPVLDVLGAASPLVHRLAAHYLELTLLSAATGAAAVLLIQRELNLYGDRRPGEPGTPG